MAPVSPNTKRGPPSASTSRPNILLVAAFATIAAGFLGSTLYGEIRASQIGWEASQIETNSLPSVEHVVTAQSELRHLEVATEEYDHGTDEERSEALPALDLALYGVLRGLAAEESTEMYAGEHELTQAADAQLVELSTLLQKLRTMDPAAAKSMVERELREAVERLSDTLDRILRLNAAEAHNEVTRIASIRGGSLRIAILLNVLWMLFAAVAGVVAARAVRRQQAAERAHEEVLERRAEELELFAGRVAHDLLSPLSALSFTLSSLKRNSEKGTSIEEPLARALSCLARARRLVAGVLDFAKSAASPSRCERTRVAQAVEGAVEEARADDPLGGSAVDIVVLPIAEDVTVPCASGILASVVSNLVRNAVKYVDDGAGVVPRVTVRTTTNEARVRVEVEDNGPGVPPDLVDHVFDPYVRAPGNAKPGLGLGLATVRRFVEAHGGSVGYRPAAGRGSIFWFDLPRIPAAANGEGAIPFGNVVTGR